VELNLEMCLKQPMAALIFGRVLFCRQEADLIQLKFARLSGIFGQF
jgi:hypothetical protein